MSAMDADFGEMLDTPPAERLRYYALLGRLSPEERARKVAALGHAAREVARAGIRRTRPHATEEEIEIELVAHLYGRDVAARLAPYLTRSRD